MKNWISKLFGLVPEAPDDGQPYVRCGKKWIPLDATSNAELVERVRDILSNKN